MVEEIRQRVDAAGIGRDKITIEITESIIGRDIDFIKEQVERFQALGFPVWMDDFGSGYSSLDVLQTINFQLIKFDMSFMKRLDENESSRIILTELMKLATALGLDTVCEGVETEEQVRFLQEIGCSKLQGYYFCKPIPLKRILERYETGIQIGFEDPAESAYFETVGRVNLYDIGVVAREDESSFLNYYNSLPMAVLEVRNSNGQKDIRLVRSNQSYREFSIRVYNVDLTQENARTGHAFALNDSGELFLSAVHRSCDSPDVSFVDEGLSDNSTVHSILRRIAVNPVTGTVAIAVAVLSIRGADQGATYEDIARSLAADYFNLFYVDLETEKFIAYTSGVGKEEMALERHGTEFFSESARDALKLLYKDDQPAFLAAFTKENVIRMLNEQGTFTLNYRMLRDNKPVHVSMKGTRLHKDGRYIVIGVSSVDAQMKQKEAMEQIRRERIAYSRIMSLAGDYICIYTIDPETEHYTEYRATKEYQGLGLAREGENFFERAQFYGQRIIFKGDLPRYESVFTKENVMREIRKNGLFVFQYRLMLNGLPQPVSVRAALVEESDGVKLVVGVNRVVTED